MENFSPDLSPVRYIRETCEQINKLKEENEKLKAHWDKTYSKEEGWMNELASKYYAEKDLENEALKEENEKLKEEKHKVIQDAYQCHYDTWKAEQENIVITELKEEIEHKNEKFSEFLLENKELKQENKNLEEYYQNEIKKLKTLLEAKSE